MFKRMFLDIISIMNHDYAGCLDKRGWGSDPEKYVNKIAKLTDEDIQSLSRFKELVDDYLLDFKDPHVYTQLLGVAGQKQTMMGFTVRRYKDRLYVTSVSTETRLTKGDAIISLDGMLIEGVAHIYDRELMESEWERQSWERVLKSYKSCEVVDMEGINRSLELKQYPRKLDSPVYSLEQQDDETLLMKISDFTDPMPLYKW